MKVPVTHREIALPAAVVLLESRAVSETSMANLYFDHNATTCMAPEVIETLAMASRNVFGNASSIHAQGQFARRSLEKSREAIASFLHASPAEFAFTSGGTEANNLALLGVVRSVGPADKHVVTSSIEHPAVLETCRKLEQEGVAVTYVKSGPRGVIDVDEIGRAVRPNTVLVSIMHANNEVGTIQPIREIAALLRERRAAGQEIYFHSDGVQAFGKLDVDVQRLGVDLYSLSAHKIYGPKGIGGLFVRRGTPLESIQYGGRQERARRPGTESVPAAMAFARAVELCSGADASHLATLRGYFEAETRSALGHLEVNADTEARLPNTSNLLFRNVSAEALVIALDMRGICVSTGSACSSGSIEPSHVLLAMSRTRNEARSSVRFSFGRYNTREDVGILVAAVAESVTHLRKAKTEEHQLAV